MLKSPQPSATPSSDFHSKNRTPYTSDSDTEASTPRSSDTEGGSVQQKPGSAAGCASYRDRCTIDSGADMVVAVVDPFTSGTALAVTAGELGYTVVPVLSDPEGHRAKTFMSDPSEKSIRYDLTVAHNPNAGPDGFTQTCQEIRSRGRVLAVIGGAEESIELADRLSTALQLSGNPLGTSLARRDKYTMQETLREEGLRNIAQRHVLSESEALAHFRQYQDGVCVLKPLRSMKSEDVFLCKSEKEVAVAFSKIAGKRNFLNCTNNGALMQEYIEGQEYVVDVVTRDGHHKVNSVWSIDRGYANGQFNVMFGARLMASDERPAPALMAYIRRVLDALEVVNGASHSELKMSSSGPVLIELGARPCGDPVSGILDKCLGQNQLMQTVDSYLHPSTFFSRYPDVPPPLRIYGRQSFIMSYQEGRITGIPGLQELKSLPSVRDIWMFVHEGDRLAKTVDQKTQAGFLLMWHPNPTVLAADYQKIRSMEKDQTFFDVAPFPLSA